jgi:Carboxypeptidase regulatory-like domain
MIILFVALVLLQASASVGSLRGVVLNTANDRLTAARVELTGGPQGPIVTRTDVEGQFAFANIPAGRYHVSVKKEGYVRQEYGQKNSTSPGTLIVISPGSPVQNLVFRLQPASTIAGAVRNEDGFPIANILIQALRRSYGVRGNRTITLFSSTLTDDLGGYRLYWVDPGDYYVNASYLPQLPTPVNANEDVPRAAYAPTYYPGSRDPADAERLHLGSGEASGRIDFRLQRSSAVNVRGTVYSVLSRAPAGATVMLMSPEESGSTARYSIKTDEKGSFEMKNVNPGSYVLAAKALAGDGQLGFATIQVADIDYARADVIVGPGVTVNVRLFGDAPPSTDLRGTQISLLPLETFTPSPAAATLQPSGVFVLPGVQPGTYVLNVAGLPGDAYVTAAQSAGRDLLSQFVQVDYENGAPLDIQLAFDGGQIAGSVADATGKVSDGATIVLVPDKARRTRPDQYRVTTSDTEGTFAIRGIPPGEYKLFAWQAVEPNAYLNDDFMLNYENLGMTAQVSPGERKQMQIRVIPAP